MAVTRIAVNRETGAFEWFSALLKEIESSFSGDLIRINTYLTGRVDEAMMYNIAVNDVGSTYDPLTNLRSRTHFGRPQWNSIFAAIREGIEAGTYLPGSESSLTTNVHVFYCGPGALAKDLKRKVEQAGSPKVGFRFL